MTQRLFLFLLGLLFTFKIFTQESQETNTTIIEANREPDKKLIYSHIQVKNSQKPLADSQVLFNLPGLALTQNGGHLDSSKIIYRGLSGRHLDISFDGLKLINPATGFFDANNLFLFSSEQISLGSQKLSISLPDIKTPLAHGYLGIGTLTSLKAGTRMGVPISPYSSIFLATQLQKSKNNFVYQDPKLDLKNAQNKFTRNNNFQSRLQSVGKYNYQKSGTKAQLLLATNIHLGGIPGYAFAPTNNLTTQNKFIGVMGGVSQKFSNTKLNFKTTNSIFDYQTRDNNNNHEKQLSSTHEISLSLDMLKLPSSISMSMENHLILERAYFLRKTRIGGGLSLNRTSFLKGKLRPTIFSTMKITGYNYHGLLFNKNLGVSISPLNNLYLAAKFVRTQKLPTFMELFSNNNFFMGNPDLKPESIIDLEFETRSHFLDMFLIQANAYVGFIKNVIVYAPYLATQLRPKNSHSASRHGIDLALTIEPHAWFQFSSKNSLLFTKIKNTKSPLPHAPPFLGLTKIRIGPADFLSLTIQSRYRGPTYANFYRGLKSKSYALFDTFAQYRPINLLGLSLSITNIFNLKSARDTYEMPLPGTVIFGQIDVGNML